VAISETTPRVQVFVTGRAPLIAELVEQQRQDLVRAEKLGLPLALAILLLASGSVVAAGLPLLLALAGMAVTFGLLGAAAGFAEFNLFVPNIATMIGLGVGIDYALFVVTATGKSWGGAATRGRRPRPRSPPPAGRSCSRAAPSSSRSPACWSSTPASSASWRPGR
jgi:RND superfamily putative drug exporter